MSNELPTTEKMMEDLAKVEGLGFWWQTIAMCMQVAPELFTEGEARTITEQAAASRSLANNTPGNTP